MDPQELLDREANDFASKFKIGEPTDRGLSVTGEPYIVIVTGGQKKDSELSPVLCRDPETAIRLWREAVEKYAAYRPGGVLYWRETPVIDSAQFIEAPPFRNEITLWRVYSRLLISSRPVIHGGAHPG